MAYRPSNIPNWSGLASDPTTQARVLGAQSAYEKYVQDQKTAARNDFIKKAAIGGSIALGGPMLASAWLGGSGAAAAAPSAWSMPGVTAPTWGAGAVTSGATAAPSIGATAAPGIAAKIGTMAKIGSFAANPLVGLGVNALTAWLGKRSSDKAAAQARADTLAANREALALERQRLEAETRNADLDREDAKALNEAINELKRRELDAAEEERAYARTQSEFEKSQYLAREQRAEPYRQASRAALGRLTSMWGLG